MATEESKPTSHLDSVSVVGSVDTSEVTREDLLRELAAPSCIKKLPKITVSSRKGDVLDSVKKTYYIGDPSHKKSSVIDSPPIQEPIPETKPTKIEEATEENIPDPVAIPGPTDFSVPQVPSKLEPIKTHIETPVEEPPLEESKVETIKPDVVTKEEVILSVSETDPVLTKASALTRKDNFEVDIETEVEVGFNPYSNLCSSLGFLIQGLHTEIRELEQGSYKFKMHIERIL